MGGCAFYRDIPLSLHLEAVRSRNLACLVNIVFTDHGYFLALDTAGIIQAARLDLNGLPE